MSDSINFKKANQRNFKKVIFYHYKEDDKFGITFKHNGQQYELQCTDEGDSFVFDFYPCTKVEGEGWQWDYDNPIFTDLISEGKIK